MTASGSQPDTPGAVAAASAYPGSQSSPTGNSWTPAAGASTSIGKTRAQVRAELLQAEEAGLLPTLNAEYPPSADTIVRNQAQFQQTRQAWRADFQAGVAAR
ncbi:hypothetical protein BCY88_08800 [Paraburkholderia fungorum]|uniref:DUF4148 domain-containing protein n=1 Tax=Paraburkholderia fungorum TaxID=134537 RepID=A0A420FSV8_9BURK|nr:hypothetical protein BCY88_08800 [Paraburkholderia fungorum]